MRRGHKLSIILVIFSLFEDRMIETLSAHLHLCRVQQHPQPLKKWKANISQVPKGTYPYYY